MNPLNDNDLIPIARSAPFPTLRALSIWQPYATLVAERWKAVETRGWATGYRGLILICSARRPIDPDAEWLLHDWTEDRILPRFVLDYSFPLGRALALARVEFCKPVETLTTLAPQERELGDFRPGRFGWGLKVIHKLAEPFEVRGQQGIFHLRPEQVPDQAQAELARFLGG